MMRIHPEKLAVKIMEEVVINSGDTAWMLMSAGLVTLMIPGLFFSMAAWSESRVF